VKFHPVEDFEGLNHLFELLLNEGLNLQDNLDGGFYEITTSGSRQEVRHSLGRVPIGFLVIYKSAECDIWGDLLSSWTNELLYLNASAANVDVRLFVL